MCRVKLSIILFASALAFAQEEIPADSTAASVYIEAEADTSANAAVADAVAAATGGGAEWLGWARIAAYGLAAICGTVAIVKHLDAQSNINSINAIKSKMPASDKNGEYWAWHNQNMNLLAKNKNDLGDAEKSRNTFGIIAGVAAIGGTVTFFF